MTKLETKLPSSLVGRHLDSLFLLSDNDASSLHVPKWRISSLRIILFCGVLICLTALISTFPKSIESNLIHNIAITFGFFGASFLLLLASRKYYKACAHALLLLIVSGSVTMNLFLTDIELAKIGSMFMYTCPVIALILLGYKTALVYGLLNVIPYYLIVNNIDLSLYSGVQHQLSNAHKIIHELLFLFFNICIPLAVARTSIAAKRLNDTTLRSAKFLREKNKLYRTFFTESSKAMLVCDLQGKVCDFNYQADTVFTLSKNSANNHKAVEKIIGSFAKQNADNPVKLVDYKGVCLQVTSKPIPQSQYTVYEFTDCTVERELKSSLLKSKNEIKRLRFFDKKTNLPNKYWFELKCKEIIKKRPSQKHQYYIVVLKDADNEYYQMKYGNDLSNIDISNTYQQLTEIKGLIECSAYIGLNRLAFLTLAPSPIELENRIESQLKPYLESVVEIENKQYKHSFLFGYERLTSGEDDITSVMNNAAMALKQSRKISPIHSYSKLESQSFIEKHEISILLSEAIKNNELEIYYQPKLSSCGQCVGLEALTRWNKSPIGGISPAVFIPIAEEYGMIDDLTDFVIRSVCQQLSKWNANKLSTVPVAINISLINFNRKDFMSKLIEHLTKYNVSPKQIELELTETALEENQEYSLNLMKTLQAWGFAISIDDFGVGYSNISRIAEFPIDKLKLDRSLINKVSTCPRQRKLATVILFMCKELDISCVAEGIETKEQKDIMLNLGCQEFQGFYFSMPLSTLDYEQHIKQFGTNFANQNSPIDSVSTV